MDIPKESEVIETIRCTSAVSFKYLNTIYSIHVSILDFPFNDLFNYRYKLSLIKPSIKPLGISNKVSLRIDDTGYGLCLPLRFSLLHHYYPFFFYRLCCFQFMYNALNFVIYVFKYINFSI